MTFILSDILKGNFCWQNHASVVLSASGNYDRQLLNLRLSRKKTASHFCPFRCASKRQLLALSRSKLWLPLKATLGFQAIVHTFRWHKTLRYTCSKLTPCERIYRPLVSDLLTVCQVDIDTAFIPNGFLQPQGCLQMMQNAVWDANGKPQREREIKSEQVWMEWLHIQTVISTYIIEWDQTGFI